MQTVSTAWKAAQENNFVPESFIEISLNVGDPESQMDAAASDNGSTHYANTASIVEEIEKHPTKYGLLEQNSWFLNGTFITLPDSGTHGENGYIGLAVGNENARYAVNPKITISFSKVFSGLIPGITIRWSDTYGEYAEQFRVTAYNGAAVVAQTDVTDNEQIESVVSLDIENYDRIEIEVLRWCLPFRRARMEEIKVGIAKTYNKSDIMALSHSSFVDPLSADLPKSDIRFEIKNLNGEYNPENPQGTEKYLMERQMLTVRYGYKVNDAIEWISAGVFFMSEWETPQNGISAKFTARDALEYMSDKYTGRSSGSLAEIATDAFQQAALPPLDDGSTRWVIDSCLDSISVPDGIDLSDYLVAEVIQLCANAACCVFYQDRGGIVRVEPLRSGSTDYVVNRFNSYETSEISLSKQLKAVKINDDMYTLEVGKTGEIQSVENPLISTARAPIVANWVADYLVNRKQFSGDFRADPRLDALDRITNINRFAETDVLVTEIRYSYNGAFRGSYEGRAEV